MLYPKENEIRMVSDLSGVWEFKLGDDQEPRDRCERLSDAELIAVPASYNDQKDEQAYRNHYGWAYYQRLFAVPKCWQGQRVMIRFDAVTHGAKVYINGRLAAAHKGGFLPFELDITGLVPAGSSAWLTVAVDNRVNHSTLPVGNEGSTPFFGSDNAGVPGVEAAKRWRKPQNLPNFDFFNYAGIHRPVRLYTTPQTYIQDITLVPDICGEDGIVKYQIQTGRTEEKKEAEVCPVHIDILDRQGNVVSAADGPSGCLTIPQARLWWPWPGEPYLYKAVVTCGEDKYEQSFGIRTVRVDGTQFLINGRPFYYPPSLAEGLKIKIKGKEYVIIICHQEVNSPTDLEEADGCLGYGNVIVFDKAETDKGGTVLCW